MKLTLVVPTYGVEKYIPRFLTSLEINLQAGIEVLIINDGTKDNSAIIAEEFAARYPGYVRVVNKENGGVSSARNKGLELVRGEYIIFPDPDDYLADDYVGTILEAIDKYDSPDMIFFDYYEGSEQQGFTIKTVPDFKEGIVSKEIFVREFIKDKAIKGFLWSKAIKTSCYNGLFFNETTRFAEDYEILTDIALKLEKIVYIHKPLYYYVMREDSITHTAKLSDLLRFYKLVSDRQNKFAQAYKDLSICALVRTILSILIKFYDGESVNSAYRYERFIKDNFINIVCSKDLRLNEKKQCLLIYLGMAAFYYKLKHRK